MDITICDDAFIDLINAVTADEIAALESSVEDLESELSDKADNDDVGDLEVDLRNEWTADIDTMREQIESSSPALALDSLEDEVNDIQSELIAIDRTQMEADRRIRTLETQVAELDLAFSALVQTLAQPGVIRRAYNRVLAMSSSINWYSPKL